MSGNGALGQNADFVATQIGSVICSSKKRMDAASGSSRCWRRGRTTHGHGLRRSYAANLDLDPR
jgi:hypothetical protein